MCTHTHTHTQTNKQNKARFIAGLHTWPGAVWNFCPNFIHSKEWGKALEGQKAAGFNECLQAMMQQVGQSVPKGQMHKHTRKFVCVCMCVCERESVVEFSGGKKI